MAVVLFMGSSFGNASITNTKYIEEDEFGACGLYAEYMANLFVENGLNYYEVPTQWSTLEVYHDFQSRRYIAMGLDNESKMYNFSAVLEDKDFTPSALRREGRR